MTAPRAAPDPELEWDRALGFRLRPYQEEVLLRFREGLAAGERRFHFVAPPGSGKTVVGIALLLEARRRGAVFAPNAAIQAQWADRFEDATAEVPGGPRATPARFGLGPRATAPFLSLTYQSATAKAPGSDDLSANAATLLARLVREEHAVLVLDECHHLTGYWGEVLGDLVARLDDPVVIGLTATPPLDRGARELASYLDLVGPITHQIPLPAVVKEGNLAPYQDLVYFTRPAEGELEQLLEGDRELAGLVEDLEALEGDVHPPAVWAERVLDRCEPGGEVTPMDEWVRDAPDQLIAYVRYLRSRHWEIPASVLWLDEMDADVEVGDLARVFEDWTTQHLIPRGGRDHPLVPRLQAVMRELGYAWAGSRFQAANVGAARKLLSSRTKLAGMRAILREESARMLDDLRALVLTDYELGRRDEECLTALDVVDLLTSDPELDELDPILVTGRSLLVDDDLVARFLEHARAFLAARGLEVDLAATPEKGYARIEGAGGDWGTTTYVSLVTELLEEGVTRCLVGTRALLGEGWDSLALNTLVDLTAAATYVTVNQVRGRTIRKDPRNLDKCANNWDVVTIVPGAGYGLYDLARLERKHGQLYGVSDDGVIEKGLGHVHPWLSPGSHGELPTRLDALNEDMLRRAGDRAAAYARWRVGEPYEGTDADCLELHVPEVDAPLARIAPTRGAVDHVDAVRVEVAEAEERRAGWLGLWFLLFPLLLALWEWRRQVTARRKLLTGPTSPGFEGTVAGYARAVLEALVAAKLLGRAYPLDAVRVHVRTGGYTRVVLEGAGEEDARVFTEAVFEVLGPVQGHRYLVERRAYRDDPEALLAAMVAGEDPELAVASLHPVPSILGRKRELADAFHAAWNAHVAPGALIYALRGEGKRLAAEWFRRRPVRLHRERKRCWW